jgi:hypothetical protein
VGVTVTVKELLALLFAASLDVTVTVVVPTGKVDPEAGVFDVVQFPLTVSVAEVVKVTTAPAGPLACTVMFCGTVMDGAMLS